MSRCRPGPSPFVHELAEHRDAGRVAVDFLQQRLAIGERDVAPHLRRAGGDAREVPEAARGEAEELRRVGPRHDLGDEREREQVRQVAHGGEDAVVRGRGHRRSRAPRRPPSRRARAPVASGEVASSGVSTTRAPRKRSATAASTPLASRPAIGWPGTNRGARSRSSSAAIRTTSALVLPASVTTASGPRPSATSCRTGPMARTGTETKTRSAPVAASEADSRSGVDDAERGGALERLAVAIDADDLRDGARAAHRERERAADEAHADDRDRLQAAQGSLTRPSARARGQRGSARSAAGVPTVTRRCSGIP